MTLHGTVLGKYQIVARLGEGGMGTVYHARDEMLDRDVAIKVLRPELARQASLVERFRSEAIALARLAHPNIAALHGMERDGGQLLMIMEYVQGETLETRIHRTGGLPWRRAVEVCADVCAALDHAHDQGVVHRDIKPANLMVTPRGTIKVMDFGIARVIGRNRQTQSGRSVGTPMYMAPEQLRGEEVDGRTDIYALGAVLFELITGELAFDAESDYTLMQKQLNEAPPSPSLRVSGVPRAVDGLVSRAMAKQPSDRFPSAAAMRSALQRALADTPPDELPTDASTSVAMPETRLAMDTASPAVVAATRLAVGTTSEVRATRLADEAPRHRWHSDWRIWGGAAAILLASTMVIRASRPRAAALENTPAAATPLPQQPVAGPNSTASPAQTVASQPVLQGTTPPSPGGTIPVVGPSDPRLAGARPLVDGAASDPPARQTPKDKERPVKVATPTPSPAARQGDTVASTEQRPPRREPEPAPRAAGESEHNASENVMASQAAVRSAVATWLAAISASDAATVSSAMDQGPKSHSELLGLVRDRRVNIASQESADVEISGTSATASVSTAVAYRSPFGATRKSAVQFALELVRDGGAWRVTKARIVGSPRLN